MAETPHTGRDAATESHRVCVDPPQISTPEIDIQDLEHKPSPETRVSNKGVKVEPTITELPSAEARDLAKQDDQAREAMEKLEESLAQQPPD